MRAFHAAFVVLALFVQPLCAQQTDPTAIARRLQEAMGGEAFTAARVLHFIWAVERDGELVTSYDHVWDRWTGDYRIEGTDRESGLPWLALFNVDSRDGRVWLGETEITGDDLAPHLERAYGRFINDTYWLLMPWKWLDPGVHLAYVGTETVDGRTCDVVELTFGDVGLTSNDRYRGFVDRDSGLMVRWSYVLQDETGEPGNAEPTVWDWTDWNEADPGVRFSQRKTRVGGDGPSVAITSPTVELFVAPSAQQLARWLSPPS